MNGSQVKSKNMDSSPVDKPDDSSKSTHWRDTLKQKARNNCGGNNTTGKCQATPFPDWISLHKSHTTAQQAQVAGNVVAVEDCCQWKKALFVAVTCFGWS